MNGLILKAARLAKKAHAKQTRKYRPRPYVEHPARVAARVMLLDDATPEEVAAAWLHDVLEDCPWSADDLLREGIPPETVTLVQELTNPSKSRRDLNRTERKRLDRQHLQHASRRAKRIKLLDRIDNLREMQGADEGFKSLYAAESLLLAQALQGVDEELLEELYQEVEELGFPRDHMHPKAR